VKSAKALTDPWGKPIEYKMGEDGRNYAVISLGADGQADGQGLNRDLSAPAAR
jgi:hypothetical protein